MTHLINPTGFRLGYSVFWNDIFYAQKFTYTYLTQKINICKNIVKYMFHFRREAFNLEMMYSHLVFLILKCIVYIKLYFYDSILFDFCEEIIYEMKFIKYRRVHPLMNNKMR
jgi:hypothetical protein